MEKLAICKECQFAFTFKPVTFAPSIADSPTFCTQCGSEALVAKGNFGDFFAAYHEAFPAALSKGQKRAILDLAKKIVSGQIKEKDAAIETNRDPATKRAFTVAATWAAAAVGAVGGLSSAAAVVIMLDDQAESRRNHAEMMQRLDQIAELERRQLEGEGRKKPLKPSKRSQAKSPKSARQGADVPLAGNGKKRGKRTRRKRDPDVPLGE